MAGNKNTFLAVSKDYFGKGLQPLDILILSQVEEFNRNNRDCYLTNNQLSEMFGSTLYAVKSSLDRLEEKKYITRNTTYVEGNGRGNKQRIIKVTNNILQFNKDDDGGLTDNQPNDDGGLKSKQWKVDSQPIKDNLKTKSSKRKDGAKAPKEKKIDSNKEKRIQDKLAIRNDNPDVVKATELFIDYTNKELYDLQKGLQNRSITYPKLKEMGLPNNSSIYELVDLEIRWRQRDSFSMPNLSYTAIGA